MNKQKGISTTLSILLIILLVTIIGAGVVVYKYYYTPEEQPSTGEPGEPQDETADWKTYENEEYGISLEYPKDWEVTEDYSGYQTAACQSSEYRGQHPGECIKKLDIGLGENGETLLSINTRQCSNMISLNIDNYICFDVALSPEQQYEPPFGVEKLKYLDPEVRNALDKIKDTFYIEPKCVQENEKVSINSDRFCCQYLVKIPIGPGATNFTCIPPNIKGTITSINSQNYTLNVKLLPSEEVKIIQVDPEYIIDYTIKPPKTVGFESFKVGDSIEAWIETAVIGNYAHGINITSPQMEEQVIRERIDEFMSERIKRNSEKVLSYLTEKAILGLGGESEAKLYLTGLSNPRLYKYEITSITEIPKGTLGYSEGGYKVIIKGYEEYTGEEGEVGSFVEGLNLIKVNNQWFINEVVEKRYN